MNPVSSILCNMELLKESKDIFKRLKDLANKSYNQNMFTFSDFLSEGELSVFYEYEKEFSFVKYDVSGGTSDTERNMIRFGNPEELGYEEPFPIVCLKVIPLIEKFSQELSHRDYLGAIMNLGIERSTIGDIMIKGKVAYLFCKRDIKNFIMDNITRIKHTSVIFNEVDGNEADNEKVPIEKEVIVSSLRTDIVISHVYNKSRSQSALLFREHKVFINGRLYENNSGLLKEKDMVSVRGLGRFRYMGVEKSTNKGKYKIKLLVYK